MHAIMPTMPLCNIIIQSVIGRLTTKVEATSKVLSIHRVLLMVSDAVSGCIWRPLVMLT